MSCNLCEQRWMHGLDGECSRCVAQKRIAELEAEVERLVKERDQARLAIALFWNRTGPHKNSTWIPTPLLQSWLDQADTLTSAVERLKQDGERLDWLATEPNAWGPTYRAWTGDPPFPQTLRAAIDAARKEKG